MMKKGDGVNTIPEKVQTEMRSRLRLIREQLGIDTSTLKSVSSGTLIGYELHDISSIKLGTFMALAAEFGYASNEFFTYLLGDEALEKPETKRLRRANIYLRSMSEAQQDLACEILRLLVDAQTLEPVEKVSAVYVEHLPRVRGVESPSSMQRTDTGSRR